MVQPGFSITTSSFVMAVVMTVSGCFGSTGFLKQDKPYNIQVTKVSVLTSGEKTSGVVSANSVMMQVIQAPTNSSVSGTEIAVSPGTFAFDVTVNMEESESLANAMVSNNIGITVSSAASVPVAITADGYSSALAQPMTISLPMTRSLWQALMASDEVIVAFRAIKDNQTLEGVIPKSKLNIGSSAITFETTLLGVYQAVFIPPAEVAKAETVASAPVPVQTPILVKTEIKQLPEFAIKDFKISKSETRGVAFSALPSNAALVKNCLLEIFYNDIAKRQSFVAPWSASYSFADIKAAISGRMRVGCQLNDNRNMSSQWQDFSFDAIPETPAPAPIPAPTVDVGADLTIGAATAINASSTDAVSFLWQQISGPGSITFSPANQEDTVVSASADGTYVLRLEVTNSAGVKATDDLTLVWSGPPVFVSLLGANEATDGYINASELSSSAALFTLNATNYTSAFYTAPTSDSGSLVCDNSLTYSLPTISPINSIATDGTYSVCVKLTSAGNLVTYGKSSLITRDTNVPVFISLTLVNAAVDGAIDAAESTSTSPIASLSASGHTVAAYTGAVSTSAPCNNTQTYSYMTVPRAVDISADGDFKLCVRLTDASNNMVFGASLNFQRDATMPTLTIGPIPPVNAPYLVTPSFTETNIPVFNWYKTSGPGNITFSPNSSANPITISADADGSYVLQATLTDGAGNMVSVNVPFVWDTAGPTVNAGPDFNANTTYPINASVTGGSTYIWTKVSGPSSVTFGSPTSEDTTVTAHADGMYILRLTATDTAGNTAYDEVTLNWDTTPPIVNAGPDQMVIMSNSLNLAGSASDFQSVAWSVVSGGGLSILTPTTLNTSVNFSVTGVHTLQLQAIDSSGNIATDTVTITVLPQPVVTSFAFIGAAGDGDITSLDLYDPSPFIQFTATNFTEVMFTTLLPAGTVCDNTQTYSPGLPNMSHMLGKPDGMYAVCMRLMNQIPPYVYAATSPSVQKRPVAGLPPYRLIDADFPIMGLDLGSFKSEINFATMPTCVSGSTTSLPGLFPVPQQNTIFNACAVGYSSTSANVQASPSQGNYLAQRIPSAAVNSISAGNSHVCALGSNNKIKCWGNNQSTYGVLGYGDSLTSRGYQPSQMGTFLPFVDLGTSGNVKRVVAGKAHTCAMMSNNRLKCWGYNNMGQLGYGDTVTRGYSGAQMADSLAFVSLPSVIDVTIGDSHTCALLADGTYSCWGDNTYGQLGNGSTTTVSSPTAPTALPSSEKAIKIRAGMKHTCALTQTGKVYCWGNASYGQLGTGNTTQQNSPQLLNLGTGYQALDLVTRNTSNCALLTSSQIKCWGNNSNGQLGYGDVTMRGNSAGSIGDSLLSLSLPGGVTPIRQMALGDTHACLIDAGGQVHCWGSNSAGQLGYGDATDRSTVPTQAVQLGTNRSALQLSLGVNFTCALLDNGEIKCWGTNAMGELGYGDTMTRGTSPGSMGDSLARVPLWDEAPPGLTHAIKKLASSPTHSCALLENGMVKCWGPNDYGQLGQGNTSIIGNNLAQMNNNLPPVDLGPDLPIDIGVGSTFSCAVLNNGNVKCWGQGAYLGYGSMQNRGDQPGEMGISLPPITFTGGRAKSIAVGNDHACVLVQPVNQIASRVLCWGDGMAGQLGFSYPNIYGDEVGEDPSAASEVNFGANLYAKQIVAGNDFNCALLNDTSVKCWGANTSGQLGNSTYTNSPTPGASILGPVSNVITTDIVAGFAHACAFRSDNTVKCWGDNNFGQLGLGSGTAMVNGPTTAIDFGSALPVRIFAGANNTCAIRTNSQGVCFGNNMSGQIGRPGAGPTWGRNPSEVGSSALATSIDIALQPAAFIPSDQVNCAVTAMGTARCWGHSDASGFLGTGQFKDEIIGDAFDEMGPALVPVQLWGP